jgi:hypothetical protein
MQGRFSERAGRKSYSNPLLDAGLPCAAGNSGLEDQPGRQKEPAAGRSSPGYSLVELLVVVGISFLVLVVVFPVYKSSNTHHALFLAARQMAQDIRACQQENMCAPGMSVEIVFDVVGDCYYLASGVKTLRKVVLPAGVDLAAVRFADRGNALSFNSSGVPRPGGGTVTLKSRDESSFYYVIVAPVTGRVRISPSPPASWYGG